MRSRAARVQSQDVRFEDGLDRLADVLGVLPDVDRVDDDRCAAPGSTCTVIVPGVSVIEFARTVISRSDAASIGTAMKPERSRSIGPSTSFATLTADHQISRVRITR